MCQITQTVSCTEIAGSRGTAWLFAKIRAHTSQRQKYNAYSRDESLFAVKCFSKRYNLIHIWENISLCQPTTTHPNISVCDSAFQNCSAWEPILCQLETNLKQIFCKYTSVFLKWLSVVYNPVIPWTYLTRPLKKVRSVGEVLHRLQTLSMFWHSKRDQSRRPRDPTSGSDPGFGNSSPSVCVKVCTYLCLSPCLCFLYTSKVYPLITLLYVTLFKKKQLLGIR